MINLRLDATRILYRRQGSHYTEQSETRPGDVLALTEPVRATIRPEDLLA
ncbi:hypothetical protein [Micromonospora cremea]|nr:hypothetical protein [Micromonospora cremea]